MRAEELIDFFETFSTTSHHRWSQVDMHELARLRVPKDVLGQQEWLLRADATIAHAHWFLQGLVDPAAFARDESLGLAHLAAKIRDGIRLLDSRMPKDELIRVIAALSNVAWEEIEKRRIRKRATMSLRIKKDLWYAAEPDPRCYLCGYKFTGLAMAQFFDSTKPSPLLPPLVDFTRPRVKVRHVRIEIDHVQPLAGGGANELDNLRLACGLCNSIKNRYTSLYDTFSWPTGALRHPSLGWVTMPQPLWLLRLISLRGRCEDLSGCPATVRSHELYAAPFVEAGTLNPVNIKICCRDHDPWSATRLVWPGLLTAKTRA
ncbi:HNH endonuclease [Cryptosporangium sp. NPDC051539]|uniref:HNH endonuclease n=1 Tax=Cryptosporangium sp. NPDC051539 TaxID=3363962 RepID=UPI0037A3BE9E